MPSWRETCAAMPASPSEVSAAHRPTPCRLLPHPCPPQGLCSSGQTACWLPKGARPPAGLCSGTGSPLRDPWGALCTASARAAQAHACVLAHPCTLQCMLACTLHTCAGLHTSSTCSCRLAPPLCALVHTHTDSAPRDAYLLIAQDGLHGRRRAAGRGWGSQ